MGLSFCTAKIRIMPWSLDESTGFLLAFCQFYPCRFMVSGSFGGSWNGLFFTQTPFFCFYCAFPFFGLSRTENRLAERDFSSGAEWWWVVDILCRKCPSGDEWKGFKYLVNLYLPRKTVLEWNGRKKGKCLQGWRVRSFFRMVRGGGKRNGSRKGKRLSFRVSLTARESLEIFHGGFFPDYAPHFGWKWQNVKNGLGFAGGCLSGYKGALRTGVRRGLYT